MKILFVEDDDIIASGLVYALETEGYTVIHCFNSESTYAAMKTEHYTLAILDLTLPDGSGFDICKKLKALSNCPVIFLTAVDDEGNTVKGLEMGADDYITKPFRIRELLARIKVVLRRKMEVTEGFDTIIMLKDITINTQSAKVYRNNIEILLTALEYRLLLTFAHNKGLVMTRGKILESLWDVAGNFVNDNTLTVYIKRLREKLEIDPQSPEIIQTVRGLGYKAGG